MDIRVKAEEKKRGAGYNNAKTNTLRIQPKIEEVHPFYPNSPYD